MSGRKAWGERRRWAFGLASMLHVLAAIMVLVAFWAGDAAAQETGTPAVDGPPDLRLEAVKPRPSLPRPRPPPREKVDAQRPPGAAQPEIPPAVAPPPEPGPLEPEPAEPEPPLIWGESGFGLSLADRIALAPAPTPAPTSAPKRERLSMESVERGLRSAIREKDESLGLGAPERGIVTQAVRSPLRATPAPSGTHVTYEIAIDRTGVVTSVRRVRASAGDEILWREADRAIEASLRNRPIPLGIDARRAGVRIVVAASILHALPSGSVDAEWVGDCTPESEEGGTHGTFREINPSASFFQVGGSLHGDRPHGTCTAYEDPNAIRHIEVRTTTTSTFANEPPPPGKPKPAQLLPWIKKSKPPP